MVLKTDTDLLGTCIVQVVVAKEVVVGVEQRVVEGRWGGVADVLRAFLGEAQTRKGPERTAHVVRVVWNELHPARSRRVREICQPTPSAENEGMTSGKTPRHKYG